MKLYHGSTVLVDKPEIRNTGAFLDFGIGFYTTTSYEQAERWAKIKMRREKVDIGYVSEYDFDYEAAKEKFIIHRYETAEMDWLLFVTNNRQGNILLDQIDMHIGPVADDNVYQSIRLFETGVYDAEETVKRLKTEVLRDQWTFHSEQILECCKFAGSVEIKGES